MERLIRVGKHEVIWNYIGTIVNLFANVMIIPILLVFLDDREYGIWNIFVAIGGITTLFDFGFNVTFSRNVTYSWSGVGKLEKDNVRVADGEPNYILLKQVINACRAVYFILSLVALVLIGSIGTVYVITVWNSSEVSVMLCAWIVYLVAIFLNLYYGYYDALLRGVGAIAEMNKARVFSRSIQLLLTMLLMSSGFGLVGASIAYCAYGLIFRLLAKYFFYRFKDVGRKIHEILPPSKNEIFSVIRTVWHNAWKDGIVQVSNYFSNQATVILASMYLSLSSVGGYSLAIQMSQALITMASVIQNTYQPAMQAAYAKRNQEYIKNILSLELCCFLLISVSGSLIIVCLGIPILSMLRPSLALSPCIYIGLIFYQFLLKERNCYTSYLAATNRIIYHKSFLVSGLLSIVFSWGMILLSGQAMISLILGQILSQLFFNAWFWPRYVHKELELSITEMPKRALGLLLGS